MPLVICELYIVNAVFGCKVTYSKEIRKEVELIFNKIR